MHKLIEKSMENMGTRKNMAQGQQGTNQGMMDMQKTDGEPRSQVDVFGNDPQVIDRAFSYSLLILGTSSPHAIYNVVTKISLLAQLSE